MARKRGSTVARSNIVYQFKITLFHIEPAIWRRILVQDCSLDNLHEAIQTAMGWTNSHLHHFLIGVLRYGDPDLLGDEFEEFEGQDSRVTLLSSILDQQKPGFAFHYEYDFGDGWAHDIVFEKQLPVDANVKYPLCVDGARSCPPEDVGGSRGYRRLIEVLGDPSHADHLEMREWAGDFAADNFAIELATQRMQQGFRLSNRRRTTRW